MSNFNLRPVAGDVEFVAVRRGRQSAADESLNDIKLDTQYVWTEGVDYVPDSDESQVAPKLSTMRQKLMGIAKKLSQKLGTIVSVKTEKGTLSQKDENGNIQKVPGLAYYFIQGLRRKPKKKATVNDEEVVN